MYSLVIDGIIQMIMKELVVHYIGLNMMYHIDLSRVQIHLLEQ